ncbi:MAG: sigma-70 family RNA polymerase sigma factor [Candidatus Eisenbacteria bacterium]
MSRELEVLVERLRAGIEREESARRLDRELRPRLTRYFAALGSPASEIEDLVQQTLIRVFRHASELKESARFLPWLFTIARNLGRTVARRRPEPPGLGDEVANLPDPASRGEAPQRIRQEAVERLRAVERAMARLPEQQRRCLILVVRDELSYRQAGALLGLSELTVRNHLREARRRLRLEVNVPEVSS